MVPSLEEYKEYIAKESKRSNFDRQEEIKNRLVREGAREVDAIIQVDQYYGFPPGEYWQAKHNVYPKRVQPEGRKELWVDYIRCHPAALISSLELQGTYESYSLLMKAWTLLYNNDNWTIEQVCEYYSSHGKLSARTIKGRLKKLAEYRLTYFGW